MSIETKRASKLFMGGERVSVSDAIVQVLYEAGIDMVFGIPGGNMVSTVFDALHRRASDIRTILVREESLAGVMGEVYGRLTRRPGVVIAQGAWLLANAGMGTLEAHLSASPMLLLGDLTEAAGFSHHAPYQSGSGAYGSWDARTSMSGITKATMIPTDGVQAVQLTQLAIKHATSGEPGPVALLYPERTLFGDIDPAEPPRTYQSAGYLTADRSGADNAAVEAAVQALCEAERPVIIAGNGVCVSQAYAELAQLSALLSAPVATTPGGKSAIAETDELALGVFGTFGQTVANMLVGSADVLLVVGSKLGASDTAKENAAIIDPERQTIIQVDIEPLHAGWTFPADQVLVGDARSVLRQLVTEAQQHRHQSAGKHPSHSGYVAAAKAEHGFFDEPEASSEASPLLPQRTIRDLQRALPDDAMVCCDAGENRIFMTHLFQSKQAGTFVQSAGVGGMGYAIPAALAAKLVRPSRSAIAVCGDGGFAMTMNGLMTARDENIPIVVLVMNNAALGWVKHEQAERGTEFASDLHHYDYAAIARSMGCRGWRVDEAHQLAPAIDEALRSGETAVIDVATSLSQSFRKVTSPLAE